MQKDLPCHSQVRTCSFAGLFGTFQIIPMIKALGTYDHGEHSLHSLCQARMYRRMSEEPLPLSALEASPECFFLESRWAY